jgi:DNA replicative helicase MCM subunit Mcm2 (Cdc46/Mcm family)
MDPETHTIDIDRISTGISASQKSKIILVREAILRLESRLGKLIPVEEIMRDLSEKTDQETVEDALLKLKTAGDIFEPKRGFIQRI